MGQSCQRAQCVGHPSEKGAPARGNGRGAETYSRDFVQRPLGRIRGAPHYSIGRSRAIAQPTELDRKDSFCEDEKVCVLAEL